jgi:hypothetical protein
MKNLLLVLALTALSTVNAQWINQNIDNGLDDPYNICWNKNKYGETLKLENAEGKICLYLLKETDCPLDKYYDGIISFYVQGVWHKYGITAFNMGNKILVLEEDLLGANTNQKAIQHFKQATVIKFRVDCDDEDYEFNMSGSASALKFISQ